MIEFQPPERNRGCIYAGGNMNDVINKKDDLLPPRPGEKPAKKEIKGVPYIVYINGQPVKMSKTEALGILAQITQLLIYFDNIDNQEAVNNG